MSLTSILRRENNRKNLKTWFRQNFPVPKINPDKKILVKQRYYSTGLIGTAFDYLMRFEIKRINKNTTENQWNADIVIQIIKEELIKKNSLLDKQLIKILLLDYKNGLKALDRFLITGVLSNKLIEFTILLARLDFLFRTRNIELFINIPDDQAIDEIKKLYKITPWNQFQTEGKYFLNPHFKDASILVGGADADLIMENTLIDIKTNAKLELNRYDFNQIMGYFILSLIGKINGEYKSEINTIGIYFARFGYLWTCSLSDFFDEKEFNTRIVNEFKILIENKSATFPFKRKPIKKIREKIPFVKKFISSNTSRRISSLTTSDYIPKNKLPPLSIDDILDDD